jgi:hypothetical protein
MLIQPVKKFSALSQKIQRSREKAKGGKDVKLRTMPRD